MFAQLRPVTQGLDPEEIIVLTPHRLENSVLEPIGGCFVDFRSKSS